MSLRNHLPLQRGPCLLCPPLKGKLSDYNLLTILETLLPLLMAIPYNQLNVVHSLPAILTKAIKYIADHSAKFVRPACFHSTTSQSPTTP
jgi:hypothetical protein